MKINIDEAISFFDDNMERGHASSIVGLVGEDLNAWAFKHYMESVKSAYVEILPDHVTSGKKGGKWLDRWIYVKEGGQETLYQCEIKNWSCTAIGGKSLALNADLEETKKVTGYNWKGQLKTFLDKKFPNGVTKVLTEMKVPVKYSGVKIEPLVIYWMALSDTDENKCYFKVPVSEFNNPELKTIFQEVHMFSVSLYLRDLRKKIASSILDIDLPNVEKRLAILNSIVLQ